MGEVPPFTVGPIATRAPWVDGDASGADVIEEVTALGGTVDELYCTSDGRRVHFRLHPSAPWTAALGEVRVRVRGGAEVTASFRTDAHGTITLSSGEATGPNGFYSGPAPLPQVVLLNTDGRIHVGWRPMTGSHSPGEPLCARWDTVTFETWVDEVEGDRVRGAPTATVDGGSIRVDHLTGWRGGRYARLTWDARGPDGRLASGPRTIAVRWTLKYMGPIEVSVPAVVKDDGSVCVGAKP